MADHSEQLRLDAWPRLELEQRLAGGARNVVFLARRGDRRFVVRRSSRSPAALAWELELLVVLDDAGFVVPRPVADEAGRLSVDGTWVAPFLPGRRPVNRDDWVRAADRLAALHQFTLGHPQRPGFASSAKLLNETKGGDIDLSLLPADVVATIRECWRAVQVGPASVVHGDPGVTNLVIADDGSVSLIDWDEARVDVGWFDLAALPENVPLPVDEGPSREVIVTAGVAWEAATSWRAEPNYARRRLAELLSREPPT